MGLGLKLFLLAVVGSGVAVYFSCLQCDHKVPEIAANEYWGPKILKSGENLPVDDPKINKFVINVDDKTLEDLSRRLNSARFVEPLVGANFEYGFNGNKLREVVEYWKTSYKWRTFEKELNKFNQFKTQIEGINVHYLHVKADKSAKKVVPLLLVHGWPGSIWEFYKMIPLLTKPDADGLAFEIVAPSIPGYGFSEASHHPGFNMISASRIFVKLMERLGHEKYYYHGGDWGAGIGKVMATFFPEKILGLHISMAWANHGMRTTAKYFLSWLFPSYMLENPNVDYYKLFPFMDKVKFLLRETGYMHIQATKPDTVGAALVDSPVGLAGYILEKFSTWVNPDYINLPDGGLTKKFTMDELLTNVMIYWVTGTAASSARFYKESLTDRRGSDVPVSKSVPVGLACFPHEIATGCQPKVTASETFLNIIHYTDMPRGGHFDSFEEPQLTGNDIRSFVKKCLNNNNKV